ncbi:MAG TPA: alpha/beta hydrolase [Gemmatimonadaceae bacterium]|nr:alpha/beta hydrolase [Gemmatimonadaceae bacterium]
MTAARPKPLYFGPRERPLFGWLHAPESAPRDTGVVVCNPFGYEAACTHRSLRHFARAAAGAGMPALRFDYDGTGDSAGDDLDAGRLDAWIHSVHHAVEELRTRTGVTAVHLVGIRFGATLAALAANSRTDVAGLVAIMPVVRGKAWLRELNALEIAMRFAEPPPEFASADAVVESVGFAITEETRTALSSIDLIAQSGARPAPAVLLVDRGDNPLVDRWAEGLAARGLEMTRLPATGYAEMMLDPHDAVVPETMVSDVTSWLAGRSRAARTGAAAVPVDDRKTSAQIAPGFEERAVFLEATHTLFGVMSVPSRVTGTVILLLNSGANPHVGPSRQYVRLARRWASLGHLVLRFDIAGIGDSLPWPGHEENVVYASTAVQDVGAAITYLREEWRVESAHAVGLCSGAYHGFKAAVAGFPLASVAVVNPLVFFWKAGMSLAYPLYQVSQAAAEYRRSLFRLEKWGKLLRGKVDVSEAAHLVARRIAFRAKTVMKSAARAAGRPMAEDLGGELESVAGRAVGLRFVFSVGDPGEDLLRLEGGGMVRRLMRQRKLTIERIAGPNHAFTPRWSHHALRQVLERELGLS